MGATLTALKAQSKIGYWYDFRKNSLNDLSGNGNHLAITAPVSWVNSKYGRGLSLNSTGYVSCADSASQRPSNGYILVFGYFNNHKSLGRIVCKRGAGNTNYELYFVNATAWGAYDGTGSPSITDTISNNRMLGLKWTNGSIPTAFKDGVNKGALTAAVTFSTSNTNSLFIGNIYAGTAPTSADNVITGVVLLNDYTITEETIKQIYDEWMAEDGAEVTTPQNFITSPPTEIDSTKILHYDMATKTADGKMADLSGNGRHGTINGSSTMEKGCFGKCLRFDGGASSGIVLTDGYTNTISGDETYTVSFLVNCKDRTNSPVCISAETAGSWFIELVSAVPMNISWRSGAVSRSYNNIVMEKEWAHIVIEKTAAGDNGNLYLNGVLQTVSSGTLANTPTTANEDLYVGKYNNTAFNLKGLVENLKIFNTVKGQAWVTQEYQKMSALMRNKNCLCNVPPSATQTAGYLPYTNWQVSTGTWKVSEDTTGKKWLENTVAGLAYMPQPKAYGTWIFDLFKVDAGDRHLMFIADTIGAENATGQDGYGILLSSSEAVYLRESAAGTPATLMNTNTSYIAASTAYKYAVTRSNTGVFTVYIKGGAYTTWTQVSVVGGSGTNPVTDTTATSSSYMVASFNAGDKLGDVFVHEGVMTQAQLQSLYP